MKYLCKMACFKDGMYFHPDGGENRDGVYNMPPDWKPPVSKVHGDLFEKLEAPKPKKVEKEVEKEEEPSE